jgi:hypothetical protein
MKDGIMEKLELYDIYECWHTPWWQTRTCMIISAIGAFLIVCVILYGVWCWYRARKNKITPWQRALARLDRLSVQPVQTPEQAYELYLELTQIIKNYLQERYQLPFASATDQEVIVLIDQIPEFAPEFKQHVSDLFLSGMVVKFAREAAVQERMQQHLATARSIITITTPRDNNRYKIKIEVSGDFCELSVFRDNTLVIYSLAILPV